MTAIAWPANPETRPCQAPANVWVLGMATGGWRDAQLQSSTTPTSIRPRARRVTRSGARVRREAPGKEPIVTRRPQEADVTPLVECDRAVPACGPAARLFFEAQRTAGADDLPRDVGPRPAHHDAAITVILLFGR